jgi:hypothetical protein
MTLQLRGKTRRFVQSTLLRQDPRRSSRSAAATATAAGPAARSCSAARSSAPTPTGSTPAASTTEALRAVPPLPAPRRGPAGARGAVQLQLRGRAVARRARRAARAGARVAAAPRFGARPGNMPNIVIAGAQWGDEGKGKVVDLLTSRVQVVARYNGGHNAGHTVIVGGRKFVLHLIPSGILHEGILCVIGNGVVVDPVALEREAGELRSLGVEVGDNLVLSDRAHLILPHHRALEALSEEQRGDRKIGTTLRGIGPAYEDKAGRRGLMLGDLLRPAALPDKLAEARRHYEEVLRGAGRTPGGRLGEALRRPRGLRRAPPPPDRGRLARPPPADEAGLLDPLRGRAGDAARPRPRDLPLRHLLGRGGRRGRDRPGRAAHADRRRARGGQGLLHARRHRSLPDRGARARGRGHPRARRRVRRDHRPPAALRLVRRGGGRATRCASTASTPSPSPSSTCSTPSTRSPSARATASRARPWTRCPPTHGSSRLRAGLRDAARLEGPHRRRPRLGDAAGERPALRRAPRGARRAPRSASSRRAPTASRRSSAGDERPRQLVRVAPSGSPPRAIPRDLESPGEGPGPGGLRGEGPG